MTLETTIDLAKMNDIGINDYPSPTVRDSPTKFAFLIDCDGGLGSAFHSKRRTFIPSNLIERFPSNSDIFLFFNSNDSNIVERMKELKSKYSHVHIFPNLIENSRNGADMNLSFVLGAINNKYNNYVIIIRHDRAYKEIKQRLENINPRLKNHVELREFEGPTELTQYVQELVNIEEEASHVQVKSAALSPTTIKFTPENLFHRCPLDSPQESSRLYRFAELVDHLIAKHPNFHYEYCPTCEQMVREDDWSKERSQQYNEHVQEKHLKNKAGFCLSIRPREQAFPNCKL